MIAKSHRRSHLLGFNSNNNLIIIIHYTDSWRALSLSHILTFLVHFSFLFTFAIIINVRLLLLLDLVGHEKLACFLYSQTANLS